MMFSKQPKVIRVKMLVDVAGVRDGHDPKLLPAEFAFGTGDVVELPTQLARTWIKLGHCQETDELLHLAQAEAYDYSRRPDMLRQDRIERMHRRADEVPR